MLSAQVLRTNSYVTKTRPLPTVLLLMRRNDFLSLVWPNRRAPSTTGKIMRRISSTRLQTRANGQPTLGAYPRTDSGISHGVGLFVLALSTDGICAMARFENSVLPWFGLPRSITSRTRTHYG